MTLRAQGDAQAARRLQEKVLEGARRVLGEEHPDTLKAMGNLAGDAWGRGDAGGAGAGRGGGGRMQRVLGEEHPATLTAMGNLAERLGRRGT